MTIARVYNKIQNEDNTGKDTKSYIRNSIFDLRIAKEGQNSPSQTRWLRQ